MNTLPGISKNMSEVILLLREQGTYINFMLCVQTWPTVLVFSHIQSFPKPLGKKPVPRDLKAPLQMDKIPCTFSLLLISYSHSPRRKVQRLEGDNRALWQSTSMDAWGTVATQHAHKATCLELRKLSVSLWLHWLLIECSFLTTNTLKNISDSYSWGKGLL